LKTAVSSTVFDLFVLSNGGIFVVRLSLDTYAAEVTQSNYAFRIHPNTVGLAVDANVLYAVHNIDNHARWHRINQGLPLSENKIRKGDLPFEVVGVAGPRNSVNQAIVIPNTVYPETIEITADSQTSTSGVVLGTANLWETTPVKCLRLRVNGATRIENIRLGLKSVQGCRPQDIKISQTPDYNQLTVPSVSFTGLSTGDLDPNNRAIGSDAVLPTMSVFVYISAAPNALGIGGCEFQWFFDFE
jgi:hypothetical protein